MSQLRCLYTNSIYDNSISISHFPIYIYQISIYIYHYSIRSSSAFTYNERNICLGGSANEQNYVPWSGQYRIRQKCAGRRHVDPCTARIRAGSVRHRPGALKDSEHMLGKSSQDTGSTCQIKAYTDRKEALRGAKYVINAIQVGGYEPCTITDFEVPKKYGLRQTIADTVGIGGIFRNLRTIPVMLDFATGYAGSLSRCVVPELHESDGGADECDEYPRRHRTVGLCHSVQVCVPRLVRNLRDGHERGASRRSPALIIWHGCLR